MKPVLHTADQLLVLLYGISLVALGIFHYRRRNREDAEDFLIAGRKLSLGAFVATLVTTFYGGILGVGEFTYRYGLVSWLTQGVFYYLFALVYAFFLAKAVRRSMHYTLPDQFFAHYGKKAGLLGALATFVLVSPAPYVLMVGTLLHIIFGWSLAVSILAGTLFSTVYVLFGGLRSVVKTDIFQFLLMFGGFGIVLPFAWRQIGALPAVLHGLPPGHLNPVGRLSIQQVIAWAVIALWTIISPSFFQRCSAARDERTAQRGIVLSVGFWFLFDMMTLSAGFYARYALPGIDPVMAFPLLGAKVLPPVLLGLFFVGMLATIMSTLDSMAFLAAITLGRDFFWRLRGGKEPEEAVMRYTRYGLIAAAALSVALALTYRSVIDLWYLFGSLVIPVLLLPLVTSFWPRFRLPPAETAAVMAGVALTEAGWWLAGIARGALLSPVYPGGVEPIYPGLLLSVGLYLFFWLRLRTPRQIRS